MRMNYDYLYPKKEKFPFFNSESIVSEIKTIKFERPEYEPLKLELQKYVMPAPIMPIIDVRKDLVLGKYMERKNPMGYLDRNTGYVKDLSGIQVEKTISGSYPGERNIPGMGTINSYGIFQPFFSPNPLAPTIASHYPS